MIQFGDARTTFTLTGDSATSSKPQGSKRRTLKTRSYSFASMARESDELSKRHAAEKKATKWAMTAVATEAVVDFAASAASVLTVHTEESSQRDALLFILQSFALSALCSIVPCYVAVLVGLRINAAARCVHVFGMALTNCAAPTTRLPTSSPQTPDSPQPPASLYFGEDRILEPAIYADPSASLSEAAPDITHLASVPLGPQYCKEFGVEPRGNNLTPEARLIYMMYIIGVLCPYAVQIW